MRLYGGDMMFKRKDISVLAWMILILILSVPILNVVFVVWVLLSSRANRSVKNFVIAGLMFWFLAAVFGFFSGTFEVITSLFA